VLILSFTMGNHDQVQQLKLRGQVDTQKHELALAATALRAAEARQRETSQLLFDANKKTKELEEALKVTTKALDETKRLSTNRGHSPVERKDWSRRQGCQTGPGRTGSFFHLLTVHVGLEFFNVFFFSSFFVFRCRASSTGHPISLSSLWPMFLSQNRLKNLVS
jgi:hypothetical protein